MAGNRAQRLVKPAHSVAFRGSHPYWTIASQVMLQYYRHLMSDRAPATLALLIDLNSCSRFSAIVWFA